MRRPITEELGFGITCIDANYMKPGVACFYLLQDGDECAVIETGTVHSVTALEDELNRRGIDVDQVRYVIPTHVHLDHAGGAGLMMQRFPAARCLAHPRGARHLVEPDKLVAGSRAVYGDERFEQLYGDIVPVAATRVDEVADGHCVTLGRRSLVLRHTPGHADHHLCIWDARSRGWFTGDVFGISYPWFRTPGGDYVMPSTTPSQFRPEALRESLALLSTAKPARVFLTHYGELPFTDDLVALLLRQIDVYLDIARACQGNVALIEEHIVAHSGSVVARMNPGEATGHLSDTFRHDAQLNAQGLSMWFARQAA